MDEARLLQLVGDLYDAAVDPCRLPDIGAVVRRAMNVDSGIMFVCEQPSGRMLHLVSASENFDGRAQADYAAYYHERNEWFRRAVPRRPPYVARGEELLDYGDFERTEFCADWCSRVGIFHMIGGVQRIREGVVVGSGVHRSRRQGAFTEAEKDLYALVMSHVGRALQIADRIGSLALQSAVGLDLVQKLGAGLMLLDGSCRPVLVNRIAENLLRRSRWFAASGGRVRPIDPAGARPFRAQIGRAVATSGASSLSPGGVLRLRDPVEGDLAVLVAPFRCRPLNFGPMRPVAALLFADPDRRARPDAGTIARVFGLTETEGRIVAALAAGKSLVRYAEEAGVSINTAKTQLSAIFGKTRHSRQSALVAAVLANPVVRMSGPREG